VEGGRLEPHLVPEPGEEGQAQRKVEPLPVRGEDGEAHPSPLVGEPLDDEAAVGGDDPPLPLEGDVANGVLGRGGIEGAGLPQPRDEVRVAEPGLDLPGEDPHRLAEVEVPAVGLATPEWDLGRPVPRHNHDPVVGDVEDPPPVQAEDDHLPDPRLVHEFLVELPNSVPRLGVHPVLTGIGDRPARGHGEALAAGEGKQNIVDPVPGDPRPHRPRPGLGEHRQDGVERVPGQVGERGRAADDPEQVVHRDPP